MHLYKLAAYPGSESPRFFAAFSLVLLHPAFILIDHGHFQFNCVCLGFAAAAAALASTGVHGVGTWQLAGSVMFVMSLCYKQIALYYAPAFFFHLLGMSFSTGGGLLEGLFNVAKLGAVVVLSFAAFFAPWLTSVGQLAQVANKI